MATTVAGPLALDIEYRILVELQWAIGIGDHDCHVYMVGPSPRSFFEAVWSLCLACGGDTYSCNTCGLNRIGVACTNLVRTSGGME